MSSVTSLDCFVYYDVGDGFLVFLELSSSMEWLNYHHLLYFWMVVREGGLRRASEKLRVSQPAISTQIHLLEQSLGEKLFQRKGRTLVPTEMGQFTLGYADDIFSLGGELVTAVKHRVPHRQRAVRLADPRKAAITVRQLPNHTSGVTLESTGVRNASPWEFILGPTGWSARRSLASRTISSQSRHP